MQYLIVTIKTYPLIHQILNAGRFDAEPFGWKYKPSKKIIEIISHKSFKLHNTVCLEINYIKYSKYAKISRQLNHNNKP